MTCGCSSAAVFPNLFQTRIRRPFGSSFGASSPNAVPITACGAILFLYMTTALHFSDTEASPIYAAFKMGCYLLPLLGGLLADRWFGRYWTIVGFSVPYVFGHFILGYSDPTILGDAIQDMSPERLTFIAHMLLFVSLALLAGGSGVIKPNISSLLGQTYDQKRPGQERLRTSAFLWFYLAINVGALISQIAMPEIRERYIMAHLDAETLAKAKALIAEGKAEEIVQAGVARGGRPCLSTRLRVPDHSHGPLARSLRGRETLLCRRARRPSTNRRRKSDGRALRRWCSFSAFTDCSHATLPSTNSLPKIGTAILKQQILPHLDGQKLARQSLIDQGKAAEIVKLAPHEVSDPARQGMAEGGPGGTIGISFRGLGADRTIRIGRRPTNVRCRDDTTAGS